MPNGVTTSTQEYVNKDVADDGAMVCKAVSRSYSPPTSIWTVVACVATRPCDCLIGKR